MDNTPDSPAKTPVGYTTQGGNYWTLITPEIWKVLHAVLHSAILSRLLTKYEASGNAKALPLITQISPTAWRHILLNGHYTFQSDGKMIDLDALVADLDLG
jgi:hypothetical protein